MRIHTEIKNLENYKIYLRVVEAIDHFLQKKGYLKIDLPVLSPALIPESYLEVFETEFKLNWQKPAFAKASAGREKLYLTPSPEIFLKRLLVAGVGDCYYLGKSFRNSDPPATLNGFEFNMLEFYKMGANYMEIADEVLEMLRYINKELKTSPFATSFAKASEVKKVSGDRQKSKVKSNLGLKINLDEWEKISVVEAFEKYAGIFEKELFDHQLFLQKAKKKGYQVEKFSYEDIWSQIYVQEIEPYLGKNGYPTLIYDYPKEFAALAKLNPDGKTAQRFEFYINGVELGDCYTELTDWKEQEDRFLKEDKERKRFGKINHPIDKGFIEALKYGLKPCSGIAIGVERLAMIFAQVDSIDQLKLINIS